MRRADREFDDGGKKPFVTGLANEPVEAPNRKEREPWPNWARQVEKDRI
jgi:hypothetical protein